MDGHPKEDFETNTLQVKGNAAKTQGTFKDENSIKKVRKPLNTNIKACTALNISDKNITDTKVNLNTGQEIKTKNVNGQGVLHPSYPQKCAQVNFLAPLQKNMVLVSIKGRKTNALCDTGAAISCVNKSFAMKLLQTDLKLEPSNYKTVIGVGGEHHEVAGTVNLKLNFGGLNTEYTFHVTENLHHSVILGIDFMERFRVNIDIGNKTMSILETKICSLSTNTGFARTSAAFTIQPNHEADINIKLSRCRNGSEVLVEPAPDLHKLQIQCAKCVITVQKGKAVLRIINPTSKQIYIPENKIIGVITALDQASVFSLNVDSFQPNSGSELGSNERKSCQEIDDSELNFDFENSDLSDDQKNTLFAFLKQNKDIFTTGLHNIGRTHLQTHSIQTGDSLPIKCAFYRQTPEMRREIDRQVNDMLKNKVIEPSNSAWHSPVVFIRKPNNEYRFAVDYRKLNQVTKPQSYPLSRLEDMFDAIGESGAKYFTSADISKAFWQVPLDEDAKEKSAFITLDGIYAWNCMPFGLMNAPATFQGLMSQVLRGITWRYALCYIDDIVIFSSTFEVHLQHLSEVFQRLRDAGLKLTPSKCFFAQKQIKYLGHLLGKEGVQPDPAKFERVKHLAVPTNPSEVKSVLGLFNFYKKFIKNYSKICTPLFSLLQKDQEFTWTEACDTAFNTLKSALISAPILAYPNMNQPFTLTCDACRTGLGYILGQVGEDGREHVIAYGGRALRKAEKNYHVSELECLALVEGIREYRTYLAAEKFIVYTDHKALQYIHTVKNPHRRLTRWSIELQEFDYEVQHRKGVNNGNADSLYRLPFPSSEVSAISETPASAIIDQHSADASKPMKENTETEWLCVQFQFSPSLSVVELGTEMNGQNTYKEDPKEEISIKKLPTAEQPPQLPIRMRQKQCPEISEMYTYLELV